MTEQTKICKSCKQVLPVSQFHTNWASKDGYVGRCKACNKANRIARPAPVPVHPKQETKTEQAPQPQPQPEPQPAPQKEPQKEPQKRGPALSVVTHFTTPPLQVDATKYARRLVQLL
jgi:hypothetical protein